VTIRPSGEPRFRVTGKGHDSTVRDRDDPHQGREETLAAFRWVERISPGSALAVERCGGGGDPDDVEASVTVQAADASAAESLARAVLAQALPSVTFAEVVAEPLTAAHVAAYSGTPMP
jgi:hypothetical protein